MTCHVLCGSRARATSRVASRPRRSLSTTRSGRSLGICAPYGGIYGWLARSVEPCSKTALESSLSMECQRAAVERLVYCYPRVVGSQVSTRLRTCLVVEQCLLWRPIFGTHLICFSAVALVSSVTMLVYAAGRVLSTRPAALFEYAGELYPIVHDSQKGQETVKRF